MQLIIKNGYVMSQAPGNVMVMHNYTLDNLAMASACLHSTH